MGCTCRVAFDPCPVHGELAAPAQDADQLVARRVGGTNDRPEFVLETTPASALDVQVAGAHYKKRAIQPVEYIHANNLGFLEGCIVKRITRWRDKDGFTDLEKIKHEVDLLIELEKRKQSGAAASAGA